MQCEIKEKTQNEKTFWNEIELALHLVVGGRGRKDISERVTKGENQKETSQ